MLENTKAFYCAGWKNGCKFTLWKDSLERYGVTLDGKLVKELLKNGKVESLPVVKAQTGEKCTAELIYNAEKGILELAGMTVVDG